MSPFDKKRTLWPTLDRSALDPNAQANFNIDILNNNHDRLSANRQQTGFGKYALTCPCKHDEMNKGQGLVSTIAACGFALLAALTISLWAGQAGTWLGPLKDWLPTAPSLEQSGIRAAQAPEDAWSDKEIKTALMQCVQSLASITAEVVPLAPIRSGGCGTPAPVFVKSIGGTDNKVSFDPPLILDCDMVVGLDRWLKESVQPAARDVFSSAVLKIVGSSYACRNVYNLPNGRLSQHAFANAIDLPMFVLADGRTIGVTHGWGPTQRDLVAAAKAKKAAANATTSAGKPTTEKEAAGASDVVKISTTSAPGSALATGQSVASTVDPNAAAESKFLRLAHDGGCKIFSTVLGPEANEVHRSHLHLDLQDRKPSVCE